MYIKYYIAAAPPRPLNLAIAAGDDRFYAFGSFNMARQYYSDKLDVFVLIKSHFSLGSRLIYNIYIYIDMHSIRRAELCSVSIACSERQQKGVARRVERKNANK